MGPNRPEQQTEQTDTEDNIKPHDGQLLRSHFESMRQAKCYAINMGLNRSALYRFVKTGRGFRAQLAFQAFQCYSPNTQHYILNNLSTRRDESLSHQYYEPNNERKSRQSPKYIFSPQFEHKLESLFGNSMTSYGISIRSPPYVGVCILRDKYNDELLKNDIETGFVRVILRDSRPGLCSSRVVEKKEVQRDW